MWRDGPRATGYRVAMVLGDSRLRSVESTARQDLPTLLACHIRALHAFRGVPRESLDDHMKPVVKPRQGHAVTDHDALLAFAAHDGFLPHACWPYRPQTTGKTERLVGFVHDACFLGRLLQDLADLNRQGAVWRPEVTPVERWQTEPAALLPWPARDWDPTPVETRLVQRACVISYGANRDSVPHPAVGQRVTVKADLLQLRISADTALIAPQALASGTGQMVLDPAHDAGLQPSARLPPHQPPAPPPPRIVRAVAPPRGTCGWPDPRGRRSWTFTLKGMWPARA